MKKRIKPDGIDRKDLSGSQIILLTVLLVLAGFLLYWPSMKGPFVLDDYHSILSNRALQTFNPAALWNFTRTRFLTYFTLAANWRLSGEKTFSYHLVNVAIHLLATFSFWLLVTLLLRTPGLEKTKPAGPPVLTGLVAAAVFLVHPVATQAVSYLVQRATSLATFFYLTSVVLFLKFRMAEGALRKGKWRWYLLAVLTTWAAMFTKEICFTLPVMIVMVDLLTFPGKKWRGRILCYLPFLVSLSFIPLLLVATKNFNLGELGRVAEPAGAISPWHYLCTQFRVLVTYLRLLILPINQNLDYQYTLFRSFFHVPVVASFILLLLVALGGIFAWWRGNRLAGLAVLWFFLTLSVESSFIPISDLIFEHRLYLPLAGYAMAFASGFYWCQREGSRRLANLTLFLLMILYSSLTLQRNFLWADDLKLWLDTAARSPNKARVLNNLGAVYNNRRQYQQAVQVLSRGLFFAPRFYPLYLNRGRALMELGDTRAALSDFLSGLALQPEAGDIHLNIAVLYAQLGDYQKALYHHQRSIELLPDSATAYNNRASTYTRMGYYDLAIADCEKALSLNPKLAEACFNLASAWEEKGDRERAVRYYTRAIEVKPDYFDAYTNRGTTYRFLGQTEKALADYSRAISLKPDNPGAYNNRGNIYLERREYQRAIQDYNQTLNLQPAHAVAYFNRAVAYFNLKDYRQAAEDVRKAQQLGLKVPADFLQLLSSVGANP